MDEVRALCRKCVATTAQDPRCLHYAFSFAGDSMYCREAYEDAEALLAHVATIGPLLNEVLQIAPLTRLEIHGPAEELAKLKEPLAPFAPTYFAIDYGFRRAS